MNGTMISLSQKVGSYSVKNFQVKNDAIDCQNLLSSSVKVNNYSFHHVLIMLSFVLFITHLSEKVNKVQLTTI